MLFRQIFDEQLAQYAYLIGCQQTGEALIIDPERDIDRYVELAASEDLRIVAVTETHIHADFLSGAREFADRFGATVYLSDEGDEDWKYQWAKEGEYDVRLLKDGDTFAVGNIEVQAVHTPGHTPEHMSFLVTDFGGGASDPVGIASGDFVFVGDLGRPDLLETAAGVRGAMEPSAHRLYASTRRFLELPDHVQVWPGHGAGSACGKALGAIPQSTVGYERRFNPALRSKSEDEFVQEILAGQPEPPLYFARMKSLNKLGVPPLPHLPTPVHMSPAEIRDMAERPNAVVVDTRSDRPGFFSGHVANSLVAPLGTDFAMVVGSYAEPEQDIYLIVSDSDLDTAVRTLARIGYDRVGGYATPEALEKDVAAKTSTPRIDFADLELPSGPEEATLLDVRGASEFAERHLPGAINIAHTRLATRLDEVPADKPVLVYCRTGRRAAIASALLEGRGFDVTLVDGSIDTWPGWEKEALISGAA